jgi:hypothetical protein
MGKWRTVAATLVLLVSAGSSGFAQSAHDPSSPLLPASPIPTDLASLLTPPTVDQPDATARRAELQQWMGEFAAWQEWSAKWRNRREPGWFTGFRNRPEKPSPPAWLASRCVAVFADGDPLVAACAMLAAWRDDGGVSQIRQTRVAVVTEREEEPHTSWWEHVHMDLLWPALQYQNSIYGVIGMHVATRVAGRWQVFTAPGALLLNLPTRNGARAWKVATNYGIGYRLFDFTFPGSRPAELHVNMAKTWIVSDSSDLITGRSIDVVGFSITFKKQP